MATPAVQIMLMLRCRVQRPGTTSRTLVEDAIGKAVFGGGK